jgi:hypothetical protein
VCISEVLWWVEEGKYVVGGYGGVPWLDRGWREVGQRLDRGWTEVGQRLSIRKKLKYVFLKGYRPI